MHDQCGARWEGSMENVRICNGFPAFWLAVISLARYKQCHRLWGRAHNVYGELNTNTLLAVCGHLISLYLEGLNGVNRQPVKWPKN